MIINISNSLTGAHKFGRLPSLEGRERMTEMNSCIQIDLPASAVLCYHLLFTLRQIVTNTVWHISFELPRSVHLYGLRLPTDLWRFRVKISRMVLKTALILPKVRRTTQRLGFQSDGTWPFAYYFKPKTYASKGIPVMILRILEIGQRLERWGCRL